MTNNYLKSITSSILAKTVLLIVVCFGCPDSYAQSAGADTFAIANKFIAKKKYHRAGKYLDRYHRNHPKDLNSIWLQAQTKLYANDFRKSDSLYQGAMRLQPDNDYLRLNYIHSLLEMGKNETAGTLLNSMEKDGKSYSDISFLYAQLYYWQGNYEQASAYLDKALSQDQSRKEWNDLHDQLQIASSPKLSINTSYITDNQPLTAVISTVRFENYFSRLLNIYINCDEYHFLQDKVSDAPWITAGDKLFFPKAGLQLNAGGGVFSFPVKGGVSWSGHLGVTKKISQQFDFEVAGDHMPYFDTKASIDTNIAANKIAAMLNWHRRGWKAQAAYLGSSFDNNSYVYSVYGWVLAPIVTFKTGSLNIGLSSSYSNSSINSYSSINSLSEILANFTTNQSIPGVYTPYFTPNSLYVNAALLSFNVNISNSVSLAVNGDIGAGSINNPYLFLDKNSSGTIFINKGYSVQNFTPADASVALNYHIDKTWLLQAKYVYRSTYFFTSNYGSIGIQKSFTGVKRAIPHDGKSAFMQKVRDIEERLHKLYTSANADELKRAVAKIKDELIALRDEQKTLKNTSEILPNSEKANQLQNRYDSLNDMVSEISAVSLDDQEGGNKKEWLVDKEYELSSISYNGDED